MRRLQGEIWYNYRKNHKLSLICISKSKNGNYRADVLDEYYRHFYHWLHPIEAAKLEKSNYFDTHVCWDSDIIHNGNLNRLIQDHKRYLQKQKTVI